MFLMIIIYAVYLEHLHFEQFAFFNFLGGLLT